MCDFKVKKINFASPEELSFNVMNCLTTFYIL